MIIQINNLSKASTSPPEWAMVELNVKKIEHILRQVLSPRHFSNYTGSPDRIVADDKAANVNLYDAAGNHTSATANALVIDLCLNKDKRNLHAITLPSFFPSLCHTSTALLWQYGLKIRRVQELYSMPHFVPIRMRLQSMTLLTWKTFGIYLMDKRSNFMLTGYGTCASRIQMNQSTR